MKTILRTVLFLPLVLVAAMAFAAIEELGFSSQEQHDRYQKLITELRCPKCLNANLAGSDAPIAADLRAEIYDQITEGQDDKQIIAFMKARYGDFILYRPPLNPGTILLWFGPPVLLLAGLYIVRRMLKTSAALPTEALSSAEQHTLEALLTDKKDQA